jgi:hypothetical protein
LKWSAVPLGVVGAGAHVLSVTLTLSGGASVSDTVVWFIETGS